MKKITCKSHICCFAYATKMLEVVGILSKTLVFLYLLYRLRNKIMGCHADFFSLFFSAQNSSSVELRRWLSSFLLQGARKLQRSCTHKIRVWWVSSPSCDKIKVTRNSSITSDVIIVLTEVFDGTVPSKIIFPFP